MWALEGSGVGWPQGRADTWGGSAKEAPAFPASPVCALALGPWEDHWRTERVLIDRKQKKMSALLPTSPSERTVKPASPPLPPSGYWRWPLNSVQLEFAPSLFCILSYTSWFRILKLHYLLFLILHPPPLVPNFSKSVSRIEKDRLSGGMKFTLGRISHQRGQLSPICLGKAFSKLLVMSFTHK